ncbi:coiled-coil and C2 domain-containing protein 2A-like [Octopus sinensis]|uniref:Coiled-coil and C2 domain-containing protein 2A-like n=1 Tax=Octopus sinensis TaxID=2607531 RepID=A0A6P7U312_9MOLL|nr:coiled-coil and C2 domain-containing protein 2A-like [Octopus sinensis]
MGKSVYLIAGRAIPEGNTFYVLTEEQPGDYVIWNPVTAQHWPVEDQHGALITGFPINLTFTTIKAVVDATFAMGMHDIVGNDVEFALAVHVYAYPCDIFSVWVYFGNMIRIYDV